MLPTGRNIHAMDPYRMPSLAALDRGSKAAEAILQVRAADTHTPSTPTPRHTHCTRHRATPHMYTHTHTHTQAEPIRHVLQAHREANDGAWPETVAVNLWGLDSIKTKGESGGCSSPVLCRASGHAA